MGTIYATRKDAKPLNAPQKQEAQKSLKRHFEEENTTRINPPRKSLGVNTRGLLSASIQIPIIIGTHSR